MSFTDIPVLLNEGAVDSAVMAIENSIAGAILPNYALIDEFDLSIEGTNYTVLKERVPEAGMNLVALLKS